MKKMNYMIMFLFGISGATALVYEVLWNKFLGLVLGNTVSATATTLAVFMGGMALGSFLGGRLSEGIKKNISTYGIIEALIGIYCILIPTITSLFTPILQATYNNGESAIVFGLVRFGVLSLVLLLPSTLMGATFPLLAGFLARENKESEHLIALLYGINCAGAVSGTLLASFVAIPMIGQSLTAVFAGTVNLLVSMTAIVTDPCTGTQRITGRKREEELSKNFTRAMNKGKQNPCYLCGNSE